MYEQDPGNDRKPAELVPARAEAMPQRPSIWIGSLLDYNNSILHGDWIDAAGDAEAIQADIATILRASPTARQTGEVAEEWGIFDHDGFSGVTIGEYESIDLVSRLAKGIVEHGPAYGAYYNMVGDQDELVHFDEAYVGHWDSVEAYAEHIIDETGYEQTLDQVLPASLRPYLSFDTEQLARDMQYEGSLYSVDHPTGGVWLFSER